MKIILLLTLLLSSISAFCAQVKVRAREHFEVHEVHQNSKMETYTGLTNTINVWLEEPYEYSIGLALTPVIANLKASDNDSVFGDRILQQNIGIEYKFFPKIYSDYIFLRPAVGYTRLRVDKGDKKNFFGQYGYLGIGYEIPKGDFGLALEMAYRYSDYQDAVYVRSITPSIGFHFYKKI